MNKKKAVVSVVPAPQGSVVVIGKGNNYNYGYSSNLTTWTFGNISPSFTTITLTALCCGNVNAAPLWVTVGNVGTTWYSSTSTNGTTWTTPSSNISGIFKSGGWLYNALNFGYDKDGNGIFLATGYGGTSGSASVAISSDGLNWVGGGFPFATTYFGNNCYYGNGYWVVVGNTGNNATVAMYSNTISIAGNASITWATCGTFTNPAYGVVYTGSRWFIGSNATIYLSSTNVPNSTYSSATSGVQWPTAMMNSDISNVVYGGAGTSAANLYYVSLSNIASTTPSTLTSSRTFQIDYIKSTSTWVAGTSGVIGSNNSFYISTNGTSWTGNSVVNNSIPLCVGVAASR
jgi:hypothetical protein